MSSIVLRFGLAAGLALCVVGGAAGAQAAPPAEIPPQSYSGAQYVDSTGCVFIRAGNAGLTRWIPRLTRSREQLCGFRPTFPSGAPPGEAWPDDVPIITGVLSPPPEGAPPEGPVSSLAPSSPLSGLFGRSAAPASPEVRAPETDLARRALTRAEFCDGRVGPQPGFVSSATGEVIDCGGAAGSGTSGTPALLLQDGTGTQPTSLEALCAESAATGLRFVYRDSGRPIECAPTAALVPGTAATPAEVAQAHRPRAAGTPVHAVPIARSAKHLRPASPAVRPEPPASQVVTVYERGPAWTPPVGAVTPPPPGYEPVWNDGRINFARGLPPHLTVAHAGR